MPTTYPQDNLDQPGMLLALLGSHWSRAFDGYSLVENYVAARAERERQTLHNLQETTDCISRQKVPVYHNETWVHYTIKQSDQKLPRLLYGSAPVYGKTDKYGDTAPSTLFSFQLPAGIVSVACIFNRRTQPSVTLTQGIDYTVADGMVSFRENPFINEGFPTSDVFQDSALYEHSIELYLFGVQYDKEYIKSNFGQLAGVNLESSEGYRDLTNAIIDSWVAGASAHDVEKFVASLFDVPITKTDAEIVTHVLRDSHNLVVATDRSTYRFPLAANSIRAVGDILPIGSQLVDAVTIYEFRRGALPDFGALHVGVGFLPGSYIGGLTFNNKDTPIVLDAAGGATFDVGGFPGDIAAFWQDVRSREVSGSTLLARLNGETSVNPMKFVIDNVLSSNTFWIRINLSCVSNVSAVNHSHLLRRIVPPGTVGMILLEGTVNTLGSVLTSFVGDQTITASLGGNVASAALDVSGWAGIPTVRQVSGLCQ